MLKSHCYSFHRKGQTFLYAWAKNAPKLTLPKDVGFRVGGSSKVRYLVLQVGLNVKTLLQF